MSAWLRYSLFWSKSFQLLNTQKNYIDYTYGLSVRNYPCEDTYAFCLDIKSLITAVNSHTLRRLNQYHHLMIIISSIIIIIINYYYYYYHVILCNFRSLFYFTYIIVNSWYLNKPDEDWYWPVEISQLNSISRCLISPCKSLLDCNVFNFIYFDWSRSFWIRRWARLFVHGFCSGFFTLTKHSIINIRFPLEKETHI